MQGSRVVLAREVEVALAYLDLDELVESERLDLSSMRQTRADGHERHVCDPDASRCAQHPMRDGQQLALHWWRSVSQHAWLDNWCDCD